MATVRAQFNGTWYTLTYNSTTGKYELSLTPMVISSGQTGGYFNVAVEATQSGATSATASGTDMPGLRLEVNDTTNPTLTVTAPTNNLVTASSSVTVSGTVSDNVGVASVTVNGSAATVTNGAFSKAVSLSAGSNTITVVATDTSGNTTTMTRTVKRATSGPTLNITAPAAGAVIKASSVTVTGTVSDPVSTVSSVTVNGTAVTVSNGSFSKSVNLSEGSNTITVVATNAVGLSTTKTVSVTRDMTGPTLTVSAPTNNLVTAASSITVSGTVSDAHGVSSLTINGTAVTVAANGSFSKAVTLSAGANTITVIATDSVGNTTTVTRTVKKATSGPTLTITAPTANSVIRATSVTVTGTISDSVSTVSGVTVNGSAATVTNGTFSKSVNLTEGANTITVVGTNAVGLTTTKTVTVTRDMSGPTVTWTSPANGLVTAASSITVSGTVTDSQGVKSLTVNGTTVSVGSNGAFSKTVNLSGGANTITIVATDNPGNTTTTSRSVTRATSGPTTTITSPAANAVINAASVTVTGAVSDNVSPVASVTVNGVNATITNGTYSATVSLTEGSNTLTVVAKNQVNLSTTVTRSVVRDMTAPSLSVTSPANNLITAAASVTVSGTVSDAHLSGVTVNGSAVTVSGGAWSTTVNLSAGSNTITVIASDTVGNSSTVTRTVQRETTGPNLTITSPTAGYLTKNSTITVTGTVSAHISAVSGVTVNGVAATISGTTYTATVSIPEGANTITVIGTNQVGLTTTKTVSVTRDSTAPTIALTAPTAGQMVSNAAFTVTGTVSDDRSGVAGVTVNGGAAAVSGGIFSRGITLAEGANAITAIATDAAGNTATVTGSVLLDTIPPTLTVTYPAGTLIINNPALTVSGAVSDDGSGLSSVKVNGQAATVSGSTYTKALTLAEGWNTITVVAADRVGNTTTVTRSVQLDTQKPVLELISPAEGWLTTNRPTITFKATDEAGGSGVDVNTIVVERDGIAQTSGVTISGANISFKPPADLSEGQHIITVTVKDVAGNMRGLSASYGIDTIPPELHVSRPDQRHVFDSESVVIGGYVFDYGSGAAYVTAAGLSAVPDVSGAWAIAIPLEIGENHIAITAVDVAGNEKPAELYMIRLVTDRTQRDEAHMEYLYSNYKKFDDWPEAEKVWFWNAPCLRGVYDTTDWNRVGIAVGFLADELEKRGYNPDVSPKTDWTEQDNPTRGPMETYRQNVVNVRDAQRGLVPVPLPATMRHSGIGDWNNIEKALVETDAVFPGYFAWTAGELSAGEF